MQNLFLGVKRKGLKSGAEAVFVRHAQGLAACAADRDTAAGPLRWGPGVWGICGLGCSWEPLSPVEPWGKAQRERMSPGADSGKKGNTGKPACGHIHPPQPTH